MARQHIDLFPAFSARRLNTPTAEIFVRIGGAGPPLILMHGYPQTHACWHKVAPRLAERFTVVLCDLPGYGDSIVRNEKDTTAYSKRTMATALLACMRQLGFDRFSIAGHDRGGRVAYRLALDFPEHVERLAVLAILPTFAMWRRLHDCEYAMKAFRWFFLAQPDLLPQRLIAAAPIAYLRQTLAGWTAANDLSAFAPEALAAYEAAFVRESVIAAGCGDYRAGWSLDRADDERSLQSEQKIRCPVLALWGRAEFPDEQEMLQAWASIARDVRGEAIGCGHFLPEEAAEATAEGLLRFFTCHQE
jgi:haloacetate dehalogenase